MDETGSSTSELVAVKYLIALEKTSGGDERKMKIVHDERQSFLNDLHGLLSEGIEVSM